MTRDEADVARRKLAVVQASVVALESVLTLSLDGYRSDLWRRKAIERFLQQAIEAAVDCGTHLLVRLGHPAPPDLHSTFTALAVAGILDGALARQLAPSAGLRTRLVHEYDGIDDARVHAALPGAVEQLTRYIAAVQAWLARRAS